MTIGHKNINLSNNLLLNIKLFMLYNFVYKFNNIHAPYENLFEIRGSGIEGSKDKAAKSIFSSPNQEYFSFPRFK